MRVGEVARYVKQTFRFYQNLNQRKPALNSSSTKSVSLELPARNEAKMSSARAFCLRPHKVRRSLESGRLFMARCSLCENLNLTPKIPTEAEKKIYEEHFNSTAGDFDNRCLEWEEDFAFVGRKKNSVATKGEQSTCCCLQLCLKLSAAVLNKHK